MKNLTNEMIEKAKVAKSVEELLEIAKANGVEMTADEAATYFAQLNPQSGELDDDALDGVAGGCGGSDDASNYPKDNASVRVINGQRCSNCGSTTGRYCSGYYETAGAFIICDGCTKGYEIDSFEIGVGLELI